MDSTAQEIFMKNRYEKITPDVIASAPSPGSTSLEAVDITLFSAMEQDARTGP